MYVVFKKSKTEQSISDPQTSILHQEINIINSFFCVLAEFFFVYTCILTGACPFLLFTQMRTHTILHLLVLLDLGSQIDVSWHI